MQIIGHQKIIKYLDKSIEKNVISHAYIFSGPAHLGKFSLALEFAKKITGGMDGKVNPDIIIIKPEIKDKKPARNATHSVAGGKKDIKIEKIRELEHELSLTAYFGKHKVVIIDEADRLSRASQNALLKTLEEPPQKAVIILIVEDTNKIIATIKSRCVIKKFNLVKDCEIADMVSGENVEEVIFWSLNRPGLAIDLQKKEGELEKRKKAQEDLGKIIDANLSEKFSFFENLSKDVSMAVEELDFWTVLLRKNILNDRKFFQLDRKKAFALILNIEKSLKIISQTNSNPKLVLENLALEIK